MSRRLKGHRAGPEAEGTQSVEESKQADFVVPEHTGREPGQATRKAKSGEQEGNQSMECDAAHNKTSVRIRMYLRLQEAGLHFSRPIARCSVLWYQWRKQRQSRPNDSTTGI